MGHGNSASTGKGQDLAAAAANYTIEESLTEGDKRQDDGRTHASLPPEMSVDWCSHQTKTENLHEKCCL
uniref:Uncharacterized protein n=1 Tax=Mus spicilegus TaxID=10103 RepID=A0A8C6GJY6_MUSSI